MSNDLLLEPTCTAQWYRLLVEAEQRCHQSLNADLESYLIQTLKRYTANTALGDKPLAPEWLECAELSGQMRDERLRDVGDQCLLISGLFPGRAERRLVRVSYYVDVGRTAYHQLSLTLKSATAHLFEQLAHHFIVLTDILLAIRQMNGQPALQPLQSLELWSDTGSKVAFESISKHNDQAFPLHEGLSLDSNALKH